jgi:hypothetical protein
MWRTFNPKDSGSYPDGLTLISHGLDNHLYGINNGPCPALPGALAHLEEHLLCTQEAIGSSPICSTTYPIKEVLLKDRHHPEPPFDEVLEQLLRKQEQLVANTEALAAALSANEAAVAANTTAVEAVVTLINNDSSQAAIDAATTVVENGTTQVEANTATLDKVTNPPVPPTVTGVSPASGPAAGGTAVTVTGTAFTGATAVNFDSAEATNVVVVSDTEVTVDSPAGTDGSSVNVTVTTPVGTSPVSGTFTYSE